jgi:hypothetical protein
VLDSVEENGEYGIGTIVWADPDRRDTPGIAVDKGMYEDAPAYEAMLAVVVPK